MQQTGRNPEGICSRESAGMRLNVRMSEIIPGWLGKLARFKLPAFSNL